MTFLNRMYAKNWKIFRLRTLNFTEDFSTKNSRLNYITKESFPDLSLFPNSRLSAGFFYPLYQLPVSFSHIQLSQFIDTAPFYLLMFAKNYRVIDKFTFKWM